MRHVCLLAALISLEAHAGSTDALKKALTFHASFDTGLSADFSKGDKTCYIKKGRELVPCVLNDDVKLAPGAGKFGACLHFPKEGNTRPQFSA